MKIPITDKFLWDLYNATENIGDVLDSVFPPPRTMKEAIYPNLRKLRIKYEKKRARRSFSQFIYYLKKQGYIKTKELKGTQGVLLTRKGMQKALKIQFKIIKKRKRKDGKWLMIIFDIPEKKRALRDLLRESLCFLEYKMLQQSVWVCPYDVQKETEDFIQRNSLERYIKFFLINEIEI